jgi:hypothetical protein
LGDLGEGLDRSVEAEATTEEEETEAGVETAQQLRHGTVEVDIAVVAKRLETFPHGCQIESGIGIKPQRVHGSP